MGLATLFIAVTTASERCRRAGSALLGLRQSLRQEWSHTVALLRDDRYTPAAGGLESRFAEFAELTTFVHPRQGR